MEPEAWAHPPSGRRGGQALGGATCNHFRSRDALLAGITERFVQRERAAFEAIAVSRVPLMPEELRRVFGRFAVESTRGNRSLALVRYALMVEGAPRPAIQRPRAGGANVKAWAVQWLRGATSPHPERDWIILANVVIGLVLHELAQPTDDFDPTPRIVELINVLVGAT